MAISKKTWTEILPGELFGQLYRDLVLGFVEQTNPTRQRGTDGGPLLKHQNR